MSFQKGRLKKAVDTALGKEYHYKGRAGADSRMGEKELGRDSSGFF